jgi:hypothetical protein
MNKLQRDVISSLNNIGINVLEIYDKHNKQETSAFYSTESFTPSQNNVAEHSIIGLDITEIVQTDSLQIQTSGNSDIHNHKIMTKIADLPTVSVKYSKDFSFIWYLSK